MDKQVMVDEYMAAHRTDTNIDELKNHFDTVLDWGDTVSNYTGNECKDLNGAFISQIS